MDELTQELIASYRDGAVDRRDFLKWASVLGLSAPFLGLSGLSGVEAAAPRQRPAAAVRKGGIIKVGANAPTSIEPPMLTDSAGIAVVQLAAEYLVKVDNNLHVHPQLATSWKATNGGKTWTFALRQGVTFHNGKTMTADDVVATFKRLVNPKGASLALSSLGSFLKPEGVQKVDQHTVAFHLTRAVVDFPYYVNTTYQCVILPADWPGHFAKNPIGTGPFKLVEYVPGQRARYVKNPHYWNKGLPYLDGAEITLGLDGAGLTQALLGGSVDVLVSTQADTLPALTASSSVRVLATRSAAYDGIFMRTDKAPFNDKRVRQALALCIDRNAVIKTVQVGLGDIGDDHVIAPVFPLFSPITQRTQNYAQARKLLAAAGHPHGFSMDLKTASDTTDLVPLATIAQSMWKPAGVNVRIKSEPGSVYYNADWLGEKLTVTDWAHRPTPGQLLNIAYRTGAVWNASHWSNSAFDNLASQLDATLDFTKRKAIAKQIEMVMMEEVPAIVTSFFKNPRAMRSNVQGVVADASSFLDLSTARLS